VVIIVPPEHRLAGKVCRTMILPRKFDHLPPKEKAQFEQVFNASGHRAAKFRK